MDVLSTLPLSGEDNVYSFVLQPKIEIVFWLLDLGLHESFR